MTIVSSDLRCSRPLCSSQHTIGTTLPQHNRVSFMRPTEEPNQNPKAPVTAQPPTITVRKPGPSGPNNVHQPPALTTNPFQTRKQVVLRPTATLTTALSMFHP